MTQSPDIPSFQLYGEAQAFPDLLHMEQIRDRAAGLDWTIKPHRHTHLFQLFLLLSGQISFQIDGNSADLVPAAALGIPPGAVHGFHFSSDTEGWVISLPIQHYPDMLADGAEMAPALSAPLTVTPPQDMAAQVRALYQVWQGRGRFRRTELRCHLGLILAAILRAGPEAEGQSTDPRLAQFQALIARHAPEHWPVARYAAELGLSERTLGRLCKAQTGLGPQALVEAALMREASRLLAYTRMSAQSVGHALGFEDASYFSRRFRAYAGISPRAYRQRLG
ncbi:MAG: helix-turn-helix domain-containing protein [Rhodobacteraceae bacterium]|nr:helix-turn-helix domain-containing protein [Paracoccaceae bacterium]TVR45411.1 MAG: helix-turn-helix domain-containing protein [Paracoccaceae bacterium]